LSNWAGWMLSSQSDRFSISILPLDAGGRKPPTYLATV
jgi:hypothetical protein